MNSRRDFLKKAAIFSGGLATTSNVMAMPIKKALEINADKGTTFYDAEHIVFLMQENRSFDHMFGAYKGVRGFNDKRPYTLANNNKVWLQQDKYGQTYVPFHLDINKTKITWQGGLPHSWKDQTGARNNGKYDNWIPQKSLMTLGHYDREDIPFYYSLADAFTICDHHFCSSLTGTTPNRLFFWSGTVKGNQNRNDVAVVENSQAESRNNTYVNWKTFPELLEENDVDWKIYQNELWSARLQGETDDWLGNYGDNAVEYVKNHNVKLSAYFRKNGDKTQNLSAEEITEKYNNLSQKEKNLIDKAFTTNINAPFDYLALEAFEFTNDKGEIEKINLPKNDIFHEFREDVNSGKLPTVSWLVAPQRFSDHTSSPLYGTWYVSEALDILTQNPEVWKKTIFILTYDENDGYFDHVPPFVPPKPDDVSTGKVSKGIHTVEDYEIKDDSPIGLGFRVPLIIASPWSKGGFVNSQVFDHTSGLMFLEKFLSKKTGKNIQSENISSWRRAVCGDLTSVFRTYEGESYKMPSALKRDEVVKGIQDAKNKPKQVTPTALNKMQILDVNTNYNSNVLPTQEKGISNACTLPYRLHVNGFFDKEKQAFTLLLQANKSNFGEETAAGAPFNAYTTANFNIEAGKIKSYAVLAGDKITDDWLLSDFEEKKYDIIVQGPNGFYRQFIGDKNVTDLILNTKYLTYGILHKRLNGHLEFQIKNDSRKTRTFILNNKYLATTKKIVVKPNSEYNVVLDTKSNNNWYDVTFELENENWYQHFAGHIETGVISKTEAS
ncbi:phosphocholine-specific phospholipase C [Zhouia sp. PK063]|uniref:phosphocholine-specific phospholipase C n=1 Tax=Zhouia sp. PK063 TaxID=3373602 RepID=UPI00379A1B94